MEPEKAWVSVGLVSHIGNWPVVAEVRLLLYKCSVVGKLLGTEPGAAAGPVEEAL